MSPPLLTPFLPIYLPALLLTPLTLIYLFSHDLQKDLKNKELALGIPSRGLKDR